jgi:hypothetical protein
MESQRGWFLASLVSLPVLPAVLSFVEGRRAVALTERT